VDAKCIGSESLFSLPEGIELRMADDVQSNVVIIDAAHMVSVDSSNGKAALFASLDAYGTLQAKNFEEAWGRGAELKHVLDSQQPALAAKALELARAVENGLSAHMLECAVNNEDPASELLEVLEKKYGLKLSGMPAAEVLDLVDSALKISCLGGVRHDRGNNVVSLQSKSEGRHILPWAVVLASYFRRSGNDGRIMQGKSSPLLAHIRLAKPIA
jgi:hypothetical protein